MAYLALRHKPSREGSEHIVAVVVVAAVAAGVGAELVSWLGMVDLARFAPGQQRPGMVAPPRQTSCETQKTLRKKKKVPRLRFCVVGQVVEDHLQEGEGHGCGGLPSPEHHVRRHLFVALAVMEARRRRTAVAAGGRWTAP